MDNHCAFLELPPELRNIIYEYVACNYDKFKIKNKRLGEDNRSIATRSSLALANRQISGEYTSVVQNVAFWDDVCLDARVTDFNFRPLKTFLSKLNPRHFYAINGTGKLWVELVISRSQNLDIENYGSWIAFCESKGIDLVYHVSPGISGHRYPEWPPVGWVHGFKRCRSDTAQATKICRAVEDWENRCRNTCYRLRYSDPAKPDRWVKWFGGWREYNTVEERRLTGGFSSAVELWVS